MGLSPFLKKVHPIQQQPITKDLLLMGLVLDIIMSISTDLKLDLNMRLKFLVFMRQFQDTTYKLH